MLIVFCGVFQRVLSSLEIVSPMKREQAPRFKT